MLMTGLLMYHVAHFINLPVHATAQWNNGERLPNVESSFQTATKLRKI
jgi:hypothetical protein